MGEVKAEKKKRKSGEGGEDARSAKKTARSSSEGEDVEEEVDEVPSAEVVAASSSSRGIFSDKLFADLPLLDKTKEALMKLGFDKMTQIQAKAIPECLSGADLVGAAKTGSGKTLAFLVPIVELLNRINFTRKQGTGAVVISPTRELSLQIYGVLRDIMDAAGYTHTHGLIMGGANRKAEADKLIKGVNIVVATPGRLLDHLQNTKGFLYSRLQVLVIDEADRILDQGFEEDMRQIVKALPDERQTILFSATQTRKVEDLARLSVRKDPVHVGVHDEEAAATVEGLQQGYVLCPSAKRFQLLFTFLKKNKDKKIMVGIAAPPVHLFIQSVSQAPIPLPVYVLCHVSLWKPNQQTYPGRICSGA